MKYREVLRVRRLCGTLCPATNTLPAGSSQLSAINNLNQAEHCTNARFSL